MLPKYKDIRLSATTRATSRKRRRNAGMHKTNGNQDNHDHGDRGDILAERSTSPYCRTESERNSRLSTTTCTLDSDRSQSAKGLEQQQPYRWRMSEAPTVSERSSSAFSSRRLTMLLEEEDDRHSNQDNQENQGSVDASLTESDNYSVQENEENHHHCSSCDDTSICCESAPSSIQLSVGNQSEDQSETSESSTASPPTSSSSQALLPRLCPTAPAIRVVPNCCDYFTSPHPHYAKEVIGIGIEKSDGASPNVSSQTNPTSPDVTNEAVDNASQDNSNDSRVSRQDGDEFEMWDYVCPQYARRYYANEWV